MQKIKFSSKHSIWLLLLCINFLNKIRNVFYNFYMGQNIQKEQWLEYSSKDFFKQQLEFYRWRANPLHNTHICKVTFQQEQVVRDKEKLKLFLRNRFSEHNHISINELMSLASEPQKRQIQQLMKFDSYLTSLDYFSESLNLSQVLYVMQIMLSGYEILFSKMCKLAISLQFCFLTREGEVKVWFNRDYKSNDIQENQERANNILVSQMSIIRKILELSQRLSSNSTEFLHFSRQFRSYMERDILQNWTFPNAKKLINSYLYTYKIKISTNLSQIMMKKLKMTSQQLSSNLNNQHDTKDYIAKHQQESNEPILTKDTSKSKINSKKSLHRPLSHSDYTNSKNSSKECSIKSHSKKNSSIDLKGLHQKPRLIDNSKLLRSDSGLHQYRKEDSTEDKKEYTKIDYSQGKMRRERQYATVQCNQQSVSNIISTSSGGNPNDSSLLLYDTSLKKFVSENNKRQACYITNPYQKKNEVRNKKKLQKKVSTVSKYVAYRQEQCKENNKIKQDCQRSYLNSTNLNSRCNNELENTSKVNNTSNMSNSHLQNVSLSIQSKLVHNHSQNNDSKLFQQSKVPTKKYQFNKSQFNTYKGQNNGIKQEFSHHSHACHTVKTINKLIGSNQLSQHESNGTFMSLEESHCSEYEGILSKMGRSVNIATTVEPKHLVAQHKKMTNYSNPNKSINY